MTKAQIEIKDLKRTILRRKIALDLADANKDNYMKYLFTNQIRICNDKLEKLEREQKEWDDLRDLMVKKYGFENSLTITIFREAEKAGF